MREYKVADLASRRAIKLAEGLVEEKGAGLGQKSAQQTVFALAGRRRASPDRGREAREASRGENCVNPALQLADFPCFAIYSAKLAYGRAYKPILEELGVTYTQWIAIVALWEEDHQTVKTLGDKLFLESNTLTPILKRLEELGYLCRRCVPADEGQVIVSPTDEERGLRDRGAQRTLVNTIGLEPDKFAKTK